MIGDSMENEGPGVVSKRGAAVYLMIVPTAALVFMVAGAIYTACPTISLIYQDIDQPLPRATVWALALGSNAAVVFFPPLGITVAMIYLAGRKSTNPNSSIRVIYLAVGAVAGFVVLGVLAYLALFSPMVRIITDL